MAAIPKHLSEQERTCQITKLEWKAAHDKAKELKDIHLNAVETLRKMVVEESDPGIFRGVEQE